MLVTPTEDEFDEEDEDEDVRDLIEDEDEDEGRAPPPWCVWWSVMNAHTYVHPHSYPNQQPTDFSDFEDEEEDGFSDDEDLGKSASCFGLGCVVGAWGPRRHKRGLPPTDKATDRSPLHYLQTPKQTGTRRRTRSKHLALSLAGSAGPALSAGPLGWPAASFFTFTLNSSLSLSSTTHIISFPAPDPSLGRRSLCGR